MPHAVAAQARGAVLLSHLSKHLRQARPELASGGHRLRVRTPAALIHVRENTHPPIPVRMGDPADVRAAAPAYLPGRRPHVKTFIRGFVITAGACLCGAPPLLAQARPPIIDMHL